MIDYEKVDKLVENCKNLCIFLIIVCGFLLVIIIFMNQKVMMKKMKKNGTNKNNLKKDAFKAFNKAQEELKKPIMKIFKFFF